MNRDISSYTWVADGYKKAESVGSPPLSCMKSILNRTVPFGAWTIIDWNGIIKSERTFSNSSLVIDIIKRKGGISYGTAYKGIIHS